MKSNEFDILATAIYSPASSFVAIENLHKQDVQHLGYQEASKILEKKGLRFKDEATLMALVVAKELLANARPLTDEERMSTAVIATSNLGNLDTVVENARIIASSHVDETSAMALPNASSNVISASVAIFNQLRGPNLMLCNGQQSGLDALQLAQDLLDAKRCDRVLVLGVEVDNDVVQELIPCKSARFHGAAAFLIERRTGNSHDQKSVAKLTPSVQANNPVIPVEVEERVGEASSVTGILQTILAIHYAQHREPRFLSHLGSNWLVENS